MENAPIISGRGSERERLTRLLDDLLYDLDEENMPVIAARLAALEARVSALETAAGDRT